MYSWGDDTYTWKSPGAYDYGSARMGYLEGLKKEADAKGSERSYKGKKGPKLELVDPKGKTISSESEHPIVIAVDGTGSMQSWPADIFDRLPLLYQTLSKYKPEVELSFSVIGDAHSDQWPLQVGAFAKGPGLDDILKGLHAEGAGGPGIRESYEMFAYFMQNHCQTPKAVSPFLFVMGDEKFYDLVKPEQVKAYIGDTIQVQNARDVWQALGQRFNIYFLRKTYAPHDKEITDQWEDAIGKQRVIPVYDPLRVVDVAMGIVAKSWGNFGDFTKNLSARQDSKNIAKVMSSLRYVEDPKTELKSLTTAGKSGKKSIILGGEAK